MEYVKISDTMEFSRIIQGFWRITSWDCSIKEIVEFIAGCLERGVNTFDAADVYGGGECEVKLGKALKEFPRESYKIVTKTGICGGEYGNFYDTSYEHVTEGCKKSLSKLDCGYIDLFLIHREDPLIDHEETAKALTDLKVQGLIREMGVSNFDPFKFSALQKATGGQLRTNQIEWNPFCFEHFNSGMMDLLQEDHIHPMIWSPLARGQLFTGEGEMYDNARAVFGEVAEKYGVSISTIVYAWMLKHPTKAMPISGSSKLSRLDEAFAALSVDMTRQDWFRLYKASGQQRIR